MANYIMQTLSENIVLDTTQHSKIQPLNDVEGSVNRLVELVRKISLESGDPFLMQQIAAFVKVAQSESEIIQKAFSEVKASAKRVVKYYAEDQPLESFLAIMTEFLNDMQNAQKTSEKSKDSPKQCPKYRLSLLGEEQRNVVDAVLETLRAK